MFQSKTLMWELFVVRLKREINILLYKKKKSAVWAAMEKKKIEKHIEVIFLLITEELICTN